MIDRIDALIDELESVCDDFDCVAEYEANWHTASRISFYAEHVKQGIDALEKMRKYLAGLSKWQQDNLAEYIKDTH